MRRPGTPAPIPTRRRYNPFVAHAFLKALEEAGTVGDKRTGWLPHHIVIEDEAAASLRACPAT